MSETVIYAKEVALKFERLISCEKCLNIAKKPHRFTTCWHTCCYDCGKVFPNCPACGVPCPAAEFRYDPPLEQQIVEYMKLKKILLCREELGGFSRCIQHSPCRRQEAEILEVESMVEVPFPHGSRSKSASSLFSQRSSRPETLPASSDSVNQARQIKSYPSHESKTSSEDQQSSETVILIASNTDISRPLSSVPPEKTVTRGLLPLDIVCNSSCSKIQSPIHPNTLSESVNYLNSSTLENNTPGYQNVSKTPQSRNSKSRKLSRDNSQTKSSLSLVEPIEKSKFTDSEVLTSLITVPSPKLFRSSEDSLSSISFLPDSKNLLIDQTHFPSDQKIQEESLVTSNPNINLNDTTPIHLNSHDSSPVDFSQFHSTVPFDSATDSVRNKRSLSGRRKQSRDPTHATMQPPAQPYTPVRIKKRKLASNIMKRHSTPVKSVDSVDKKLKENITPTKLSVGSANVNDIRHLSDTPVKGKSEFIVQSAIIAVESLTPTISVTPRLSQKKQKVETLVHSPGATTPSSSRNPSLPKSSPQAVTITDTSKRNYKGETQLHAACSKGQMSRVEELLALGANPNCKDHAGWTPLHEAVKLKNQLLVRCLLDSGARVCTPGLENTTPLHSAIYSGDQAVISLLLACGADRNARDLYGNTPLMIAESSTLAILKGHSQTVVPRVEGYAEMGKTTLLADGLTKEQDDQLRLFAHQFGLLLVTKFFNVKRPPVTHLVVPSNPCMLTCNVLHGILQGCFIVTFEWVERCFKFEKVVNAEDFEVSGTTKFPTSDGPRRGRHNARHMLPRLLSGCHIFLANRNEALAEVIAKSSGARMLTREPNPEAITPKESTVLYHADRTSPMAECSHVILFDPKMKVQPSIKYNMRHTKALPLAWLLESIQTFSIVDPS